VTNESWPAVDVACSPDATHAVVGSAYGSIDILDFASGSKRTLKFSSETDRYLGRPNWEPSGRGLFAASHRSSGQLDQIAFLTYPEGNVRRITNDLSDYSGISLTADGRTIATTQRDGNTRFVEFSLAGPSHMLEHQTGTLWWFRWLNNDKILESDIESGLRVVDLTKNETTTLNVGKGHLYFQPSLCGPDTLVASGGTLERNTAGVYKMHLDGSEAIELTHGEGHFFPECTADGKWLFYADVNTEEIARVSLKGGTAQKVAVGIWFELSPNGQIMAHRDSEDPPHLQLLSAETLEPIRNFQLPSESSTIVSFSADSQSIFYFTKTQAGTTIWRQGLAAPKPVRVTSLPPEKVLHWIRPSPDGTKLGLAVDTPQSRAVLLRDTR
jgi:hypothetical protein